MSIREKLLFQNISLHFKFLLSNEMLDFCEFCELTMQIIFTFIYVLHFCFELRALKMASKMKHMIALFLMNGI